MGFLGLLGWLYRAIGMARGHMGLPESVLGFTGIPREARAFG